jgi:hypothetical protein
MKKSESFAPRCFHSVSCPAIFGVLPLAHSSLEETGSGAAAAAREAKTAAFTTWRQGDAQALPDKAETAKRSIGLSTGRFPKEELLAFPACHKHHP